MVCKKEIQKGNTLQMTLGGFGNINLDDVEFSIVFSKFDLNYVFNKTEPTLEETDENYFLRKQRIVSKGDGIYDLILEPEYTNMMESCTYGMTMFVFGDINKSKIIYDFLVVKDSVFDVIKETLS